MQWTAMVTTVAIIGAAIFEPGVVRAYVCDDLVFRASFEDDPSCNVVRHGGLTWEVDDVFGVYAHWDTADYWDSHHPDLHAFYNFNPYILGNGDGVHLEFYWGTRIDPNSACLAEGDVCVALQEGDIVRPTSTFAQARSDQFQSFGVHYLGFRFLDESQNRILYGYVQLVSFQDNAVPSYITEFAFASDGRAIQVEP